MHAASTSAADVDAEGGDADEEPEPGVRRRGRRVPPRPKCRPVRAEAVEAELEPEEEEEEDEPELGDELRHLRRADERELLGLVRPEQEPGEQVRRDRREPEAPGDEPEGARAARW